MVSAALTLLCGFIVAGKPRDEDAGGHIGSFEEWDELVRQCVIWVGKNELLPVSDPAVCMRQAKEQDPARQKLAVFLDAVNTAFLNREWRSQDLIKHANENRAGDLYEAIDEIAGERGVINPRRLGRWIDANRDIRSDGMWLKRVGVKHQAVTWRVARDEKQASSGPGKSHPFRDVLGLEYTHKLGSFGS